MWKGHSPTHRWPTRLRAACSPIRATISVAARTRATSSSGMPMGLTVPRPEESPSAESRPGDPGRLVDGQTQRLAATFLAGALLATAFLAADFVAAAFLAAALATTLPRPAVCPASTA